MKTLLKIYLLFFLFLFVSHCVFHIAYLDSPASFMAYLVALRYDAATLSFLLGLPALLYLLAWRWVLLRKAVLWVIAFLSHYTFVVLFSDLFYYGLAGKHGTVELQIYFSNYIDTNLMAIREYPLMALGYVLSIVIFFLLWKRRIAVEGITIPHNFARQNLLRKFSIVLLFIFVHIVAFRGGGQGRPLRPANAFEALTQAEGDFALNGVYTTSYALFHRTSFPVRGSPESIQNARKFIQAKGDVFIEDSYPFLRRVIHPKPAQKKNVVFIILESWSGKRVGIFGDTTNATPFFDTLARKGWLFTNAYATGRRSIASLPAAISSIPSLYGTLYITSPFEQNFQRGMGAIFREAGYATHFTYAAKAGSMGFNTFARLAGFETILTRESFPADAPTDGVWGVYDHVMFQRVLSDLSRIPKPFLAVAYTLHPHPPFTLPKRDNYTAENSPRKEYYKALKYSDDTLKDFFTAAAREMWFKDTVFVLMADHAYEETQGRDAFHIPLLVYAPGIVTPRVDNRIVSELDVLPTLVDLLQISTFHASMGKSALAEGERVAYLDVEHAAGIVQHKDGFSQVALLGSDTLVGAYDLVNDAQWKTKLKDNLYTKEEIQQMLDYVGVMGYAIRENKIAERTPKSLF